MDNIVWGSIPHDLQFTKRGTLRGRDLPPSDAFFWTAKERNNALNVLNTMLPQRASDEETWIEELEKILQKLYDEARYREDLFLKNLGITNITAPTSVRDFDGNKKYTQDFNREVGAKVYSKTYNLISLFQDPEYANFLSSSSNTLSLTRSAEFASKNSKKKVSTNDASYDLTRLFLTEAGQKKIQRSNGHRVLYLKEIMDRNGQVKKTWMKQLQNYFNTYIAPGLGDVIYNSPECIEVIEKKLGLLLNESLTSMFSGGSRRTVNFSTNSVGKGISKDVEKSLKTVIKKLTLELMQTGKTELNFGTVYGGLTLSRDGYAGEGIYETTINSKLWTDDKMLSQTEILDIFVDALSNSIDLFLAQKKYKEDTKSAIKKDFNMNRQKIRNIILKDLTKSSRRDSDWIAQVNRRPAEEIRKIIAKWGYAQTRGILGELAVAIAISNVNGFRASISGANENASGEVSMDVVALINKSRFGFQVKNFKSLNQTSFYATDFAVKNKSVMEKYFGEYAEGYYWLFANEKMLYETELIGANFKSRVEQSFNRFADNFLRISAGDSGPTDFTKSDAFFLRDKIIPSSYMYCLLIKTSVNARKNKNRFSLQPETKQNQYPEMQENSDKKNKTYHFKPSLVPNLINGMNARIEFKGINFNLEDI